MAGYAGLGTILAINGDDVAEVTNIGGPGIAADTIDVSSHNSLADDDAYRTFVAGLIDGGEISLEGNLTDVAAANVLLTQLNSRTEESMTITFPAAAGVNTWTFDGIVTNFETNAPHDDKLSFSASIKVTGRPVLA